MGRHTTESTARELARLMAEEWRARADEERIAGRPWEEFWRLTLMILSGNTAVLERAREILSSPDFDPLDPDASPPPMTEAIRLISEISCDLGDLDLDDAAVQSVRRYLTRKKTEWIRRERRISDVPL